MTITLCLLLLLLLLLLLSILSLDSINHSANRFHHNTRTYLCTHTHTHTHATYTHSPYTPYPPNTHTTCTYILTLINTTYTLRTQYALNKISLILFLSHRCVSERQHFRKGRRVGLRAHEQRRHRRVPQRLCGAAGMAQIFSWK